MRQFFAAIPLLLFAATALLSTGELEGQRPTDYDHFVEALTPVFQRAVSVSIDSLKANETRRKAAEGELKGLLKPYKFYLVNLENLREDILPMQLEGDTLALATAALRRLHLADERVTEWGRIAKAARNLTAKSFVRGLYERHKNAWTSNKRNKEWVKTLIDREIVRYALLFQRRRDNFSSLTARRVAPPRLSSSDVKYGNPIPKREAKVFGWEIKTKLRKATSTDGITTAGSIPAEDIICSYPQNGQFAFHPRDYRDHSGYLLLSNAHYKLMAIAEAGQLWMKWKNVKGEVVYSDVTLSSSTLLQYGLPLTFLRENQVYELSMVQADPLSFNQEVAFYGKKPIADLVSNSVYLRERKEKESAEQLFFRAYFRTSIYTSFLTKAMYTARLETNDDPNIFTLELSESFGKEDLEGINGVPPLAPLRPSAYVTSENEVSKLFGREAKLFLNHPNADYLSYLKENKDKLNVDSLVAIEFLPYGERVKKYRRLNYPDQSGKKRSAFTAAVAIPALKEESFVADYGSIPARITEADFKGKALVGPSPTSLTFRYVFHERANETIASLKELIATRKPEYTALLEELNALSPQVPAATDFSVLLDKISPAAVKKLSSYTAPGLTTDQLFSIGTGYHLPGRTMTSSQYKIQVVE